MLGAIGNLLKGVGATPFVAARTAGYAARGAGYTIRGGLWLAGSGVRLGRGAVAGARGAFAGTKAALGRLERIRGAQPAGGVGPVQRTMRATRFGLGVRMAGTDVLKAGAYFMGANVLDDFSEAAGDELPGLARFASDVGSFYLRSRGWRAGLRTPISLVRGATFGARSGMARKTAHLFRKYNEYAYFPENRVFGRGRGATGRAAAKAKLREMNQGLGAKGAFMKYGRDAGTASGTSLKVRWPWRAIHAPAELAFNIAGGTAFRMRQAAGGMGPFARNPQGMGIMGRIAQSKHPYWGGFFGGGALAIQKYRRNHDMLTSGGMHQPPPYGIDPRNYGGGITFEGPRGRRHAMNSHLVSQRMLRK